MPSEKRTTKAAAASKGAAFGVTDEAPALPDVKGFDIRAYAAGTAVITKSVEVCGKPHLIGRIEELKSLLERPVTQVDDERASGPTASTRDDLAIAQELEALRVEVLDSISTWRLRGLRNGEREAILKAVGGKPQAEDPNEDLSDALTEYNYRKLATQVVSVNGHPVDLTWQDMRLLHVGDDADVQGIGAHFIQTIFRTASQAAQGVGVDVPFSQRSSSLTSPEQ